MSDIDGPIRVPGSDRVYRRGLILVVLFTPLALSLIQVSSVNLALPIIQQTLHASPAALQWVIAGYALSFGMTLVGAGRAGDVMGRGSWFIIGLALFTGASVVCGLATTPLMLAVGRVVQGVGAGIFNPQVAGLIQAYFTGQRRAAAFGFMGTVISSAVAVGPVLSGLLIGMLGPDQGWRWTFLLNAPLGVLGVVAALLWLPFRKEREHWLARHVVGSEPTTRRTSMDLDPVGSLLLALTVLGIMYPFMSEQWWTFPLLALAGLLGWVWVRWEKRYAARGRHPMVDLSLFRYRTFTHGVAVVGVYMAGSPSTFIIISMYLQNRLHVSALAAGLINLPNAIVSAVVSTWASRYSLRNGRRTIVIGLTMMLIGCLTTIVIIGFADTGAISFWWLIPALALVGVGQGAMGSSNQMLTLQDVPAHYGGTGAGIHQTAQRMGTAVGYALHTGAMFAFVSTWGWFAGYASAFTTISLVVVASLAVAIWDWRTIGDGLRRPLPG